MPDYNPSVALGVNASPVDISKTLGTVANIDLANAHAGLYNLQAQQQQRQFNALQAAAEAYRSNKDPVDSYLSAGGDPAGANTLQTMFSNQRAMSQTPGGVMPQAYEQRTAAEKNIAERGKIGVDTEKSAAETRKVGSETTGVDIANAAKIAAPVIASGGQDDNAWRDSVLAHYKSVGNANPLEMAQVLGVKDPAQRLQIAKQYSASGTSPDEMNKPVQVTPGNTVTTAARLMTPPVPGANGQPANAPAIQGLTPEQIAGQKAKAEATVKYFQGENNEGNKAYNNAQSLLGSMKTIDHDVEALGPSWMGPGSQAKSSFYNGLNSMLAQFDVKPINGDKVATSQELGKETIRAGMQLINSNFGGSREAASIIQMGSRAVVGQQNSYLAAKYVSATIKAAAQRQIDMFHYQAQHQDQLPQIAAIDFNKANPPEQYAMKGITDVIPQGAKEILQQHPNTAAQFNKNFGDGTAEYILGTAK